MKYLTLIAGILLLIFSTMHFFSGYPMVNSLLEADSASSNLSHIVRENLALFLYVNVIDGYLGLFYL